MPNKSVFLRGYGKLRAVGYYHFSFTLRRVVGNVGMGTVRHGGKIILERTERIFNLGFWKPNYCHALLYVFAEPFTGLF